MKDGTYGTCDECAEDIDLARLEANPAAATCIPPRGVNCIFSKE
jgi:DnaK suppressor protein